MSHVAKSDNATGNGTSGAGVTSNGASPRGRMSAMSGADMRIICAASLGTLFEWYDFFLYGSLAITIGAEFFSQFAKPTADIFALLTFAAGFVVRPLGAIVFGRVGDRIGRKYAFLITMVIMGAATFTVGLLPNYQAIGAAAPALLIALRLLQGFAIGGEYGGAAVYVAEHVPSDRRGVATSFIQVTATSGLLLSLVVILAARSLTGETGFADWGWRLPFLLSAVLLAISLWIRLRLAESPLFAKMKAEGGASKMPLTESFADWDNAKYVFLSLFGLVMGQAVVWYAGQYYALFFLQSILHVDATTADLLVACGLFLGSLFFVAFGFLSDKIGRKPIIMAGCLIAALTYFPIFKSITDAANPALARALATIDVAVVADPADCGNLFNPIGTRSFTSSCDIARSLLAHAAVHYRVEAAAPGAPAKIKIGDTEIAVAATAGQPAEAAKAAAADLTAQTRAALTGAGYPTADDPGIVKIATAADLLRPQALRIVGLLLALMATVGMVYGPIAATLVELFPARVRTTSISLPYHIGNGWFGGLLPAIAFAMVAQTGDIYFGLWYPVVVALTCFVIGMLLVPETKDRMVRG